MDKMAFGMHVVQGLQKHSHIELNKRWGEPLVDESVLKILKCLPHRIVDKTFVLRMGGLKAETIDRGSNVVISFVVWISRVNYLGDRELRRAIARRANLESHVFWPF